MALPPLSLLRTHVASRLDSFRALPDGWDGYGGSAPPKIRIAAAERLLATLPDDLAAPVCAPASDGEVGFVWDDAESGVYADVDVWPDFDGEDRSRPMCVFAQRRRDAEADVSAELDEGPLPEAVLDLLRRIPTSLTPGDVAARAAAALADGDSWRLQAAATDVLRFLGCGGLSGHRQNWRAVMLALTNVADDHAVRQAEVAFCLLTWPGREAPDFPDRWRWARATMDAARSVDPVEAVRLHASPSLAQRT